uniref:Peptidase S8/S53 domain-containing protein n=1 Tax=Bionectria ochroleuca TaxID=29856 RepID=A0A0B7JTB1_BIOOC
MRVSALLSILPLVAAAPAKREEVAPLHVPRDVEVIPGKYIVKLKEGVVSISSTISSIEAKPDFEYEGGFQGFAGALTEAEVQALRESPEVEYVEQDAIVSISATQTGAPWGIARLSNTNTGSTTYTYDDSAGDGTCAFIIDTGIYTSHTDFGGRASFAANYVDSSSTDGNGHGTHVAGTVGGTTYGVAKKTKLYAVKVLDSGGSGTTSGVIAGMNYVTNSASTYSCPKGVVVNIAMCSYIVSTGLTGRITSVPSGTPNVLAHLV